MKTNIRQLLSRYWGHAEFRPLQEDIILSVLDGKDTLALLPTGGGKSICFQVPALAKEGICLVISPLIALMKDQVERLQSKGISAQSIISGMSKKEIDTILDNCIYGHVKFLYVSPERLSSELFIARFQRMNISLIAVDEAHCISQWGYDFRPSYLQIAAIRSYFPNVPVLALTATATPDVQADIQQQLKFRANNLLQKSFERKNLSYVVRSTENKLQEMLKVIKGVGGTGIVYVRNRKKTRDISDYLISKGISSTYYHAGLSMEDRSLVQQQWMSGKVHVMVSTNAFGMGIDKPDVRFVVHTDLPESPEAYFQEAGRAGRDEKKAWAVLLFHSADRIELERRAEIEFPEMTTIRQVYTAIGNYLQLPVGSGKGVAYSFDVAHFCDQYNLNIQTTLSAIKLLELQDLLAFSDAPGFYSRIHFLVRPESLYEFQVKQPLLDQFIRILLRSYEGLFTEYVAIREKEVAKRTGKTLAEVVQLLKKLHQLNIIDYQPATDEPQLTFTEERLDSKDVYIDREHLAKRKERFLERARAMLHYAEAHDHCRSQLLLQYFGETSPTRCGICDVCLQRNKMELSDMEFEQLEKKVMERLTEGPVAVSHLVAGLTPVPEDTVLKVLDWMIDNHMIRYVSATEVELER